MFKKKSVLVTGGTGFLGKALYRNLKENGYKNIIAVGSAYDLTVASEVDDLLAYAKPVAVVHLAATVGGIGANKANPGLYMYNNLIMGANLIEACRKLDSLKKFVMVGTVCSYPKFTPVPFKEEDIWNGYPEETNAPYGIAKKSLMQLIMSYKEQYGFNGVNLIPVNMYGPEDNFDPASSHVIPALILKFHKAMRSSKDSSGFYKKEKPVEIWGTGKASREFLYMDDCAEAIRLSLEKDVSPEPINIGTGGEVMVKHLALSIAEIMGYEGKIQFNPKYPDGQPRRCLDISRAKRELGYIPTVGLYEGLEKTIEWFKDKAEEFDDYLNHI
jgi:GDP-L-fucose synthase